MTAPLSFSRAPLKIDPALDALGPILAPQELSARLQTDDRLMWSLFAGDPDARAISCFAGRTRKAAPPLS